MNIALVDPIAATANVTGRAILHPEVPTVSRDSRTLQETKLVELATQLALRGHHPTVLFGDVFLDGQEWTTPEGVRIAPLNTVMRVPFHPGLLPAIPSLLGHTALREADVIQVAEYHQLSTFFSCIAAHDVAAPFVVWQETYQHMRFPGSLYQQMYESTIGSYVRAHTRRFIPRTTKAHTYLRHLQVPEGRIGPWIPTGIDVDAFLPRKTPLSTADFDWPADAPLLLVVGRLHPTKGIDLALQALRWVLRRHPDTKLVIRGSGPEGPHLVSLAKALGVENSVRFLERMPRDAMVDLYNLADIVLCPSRVDLMPFSLIEAGACGRPSVATDVGAIRDIVVDDRTGIIIKERSARALGTAICGLLDDPEKRVALGSEARKRVEQRFAITLIAEEFIDVYRDAAS